MARYLVKNLFVCVMEPSVLNVYDDLARTFTDGTELQWRIFLRSC